MDPAKLLVELLGGRSPLQVEEARLQREQCETGACVSRQAAEKIGYNHVVVHDTEDGAVHTFARTAADRVVEMLSCNCTDLLGKRMARGEAKCPLCPEGTVVTMDTVRIIAPPAPRVGEA